MTHQDYLKLDLKFEEMSVIFKETLTEQLLDIYHRVLQDLSLDDVLHACDAWLAADNPFFPKPGQLRTLVMHLPANPHAPENLKARAEMAWQNLRGLAKDAYNRWALTDPITRQVFRLMGDGYITESGFGRWEAQYEELRHREFCATYIDLAARYETLPPLPMGEPVEQALLPREAEGLGYEDRRGDVKTLLAQLQERLAMSPQGVPAHYLAEPVAGNFHAYTPSFTEEEMEARKMLLLRQAQSVVALDMVRGPARSLYEPPEETLSLPEPEGA